MVLNDYYCGISPTQNKRLESTNNNLKHKKNATQNGQHFLKKLLSIINAELDKYFRVYLLFSSTQEEHFS